VLGLLQSATEFIPVSSSGHLLLVPWLLGWQAPGLEFTVIVHLGTVFGVLLYFWRDWLLMLRGGLRWVRTRQADQHARLLGLIVLGTIPAAAVGGAFRSFFETAFKWPLLAIILLAVTAAVLLLGEWLGRQQRQMGELGWRDSLLVGLAQTLAIFPGLSRSGTTIAAAQLQEVRRDAAARFSFLLSTPLIVGVGLLQIIELLRAGASQAQMGVIVAGFLVSFASAYLVVRWLLNYLRTRSTRIFALYCAAASAACLAVFLARGG
jgi:undecaprenyl-diphosphatase